MNFPELEKAKNICWTYWRLYWTCLI